MQSIHDQYEIDDSLDRVDFECVHGWLTETYWSPGIRREQVERAARNSSLVVGGYCGEDQAGYLRIVSDKTTFAWICDVYVSPAHRGRGIARAMLRHALSHPDHQGLRRWLLATADAHGVYTALGFQPLPEPQRWMIYRPG